MAGISIVATAVVVVAGIAGVQGMYVQKERYPLYYGWATADKFWTDANSVLRSSPDARVRTLEPTVAEVTLLDRIDFMNRKRPIETRIYTGTIDVTDCYEGKYLFRLTSDDDSHMFIDGKMVINNGGRHGAVQKTATINLERGKQYDMQLWWGNYGGAAMANTTRMVGTLQCTLPGLVNTLAHRWQHFIDLSGYIWEDGMYPAEMYIRQLATARIMWRWSVPSPRGAQFVGNEKVVVTLSHGAWPGTSRRVLMRRYGEYLWGWPSGTQ